MGWAGPVTHRQHRAWLVWSADQWNNPSLTDHYLMQITMVLLRAHFKNTGGARLNGMRLKFTTPSNDHRPKVTREQAAAWSKMRWCAMLGVSPDADSKAG